MKSSTDALLGKAVRRRRFGTKQAPETPQQRRLLGPVCQSRCQTTPPTQADTPGQHRRRAGDIPVESGARSEPAIFSRYWAGWLVGVVCSRRAHCL